MGHLLHPQSKSMRQSCHLSCICHFCMDHGQSSARSTVAVVLSPAGVFPSRHGSAISFSGPFNQSWRQKRPQTSLTWPLSNYWAIWQQESEAVHWVNLGSGAIWATDSDSTPSETIFLSTERTCCTRWPPWGRWCVNLVRPSGAQTLHQTLFWVFLWSCFQMRLTF